MNNIYTYKPSGNKFRCNEVLGVARNELRIAIDEMKRRDLSSNKRHRVVDNGATHIVVTCSSDGNNRIEISSSYGKMEQRAYHRERILHCRMILTLAGDTDDIVTDPQYIAVEPIPVSTDKVLVNSIFNADGCYVLDVPNLDDIEMAMEDTIPIIENELQCKLVKQKGPSYTIGADYRDYDITDPSTFNRWKATITGNDTKHEGEVDGYAVRYWYSNDLNTRLFHLFTVAAPVESNTYNVVQIIDGKEQEPITLDPTILHQSDSAIGMITSDPSWKFESEDVGTGFVNGEPLWGRYSSIVFLHTPLTAVLADVRHIPDMGKEKDDNTPYYIKVENSDGEIELRKIKLSSIASLFPYRVEIKSVEDIYNRIGRDFAGNPDSFFHTRSDGPPDDFEFKQTLNEGSEYDGIEIYRQKPMMWMMSPGNNYFDLYAYAKTYWSDFAGAEGHRSLPPDWDKICRDYTMNWLLHPYINNTWYSRELPNIVQANSTNPSEQTYNPLNKSTHQFVSSADINDPGHLEFRLSAAINPAPPNRIVLCVRSFFQNTDNATTLSFEREETLVEYYQILFSNYEDTPRYSYLWGYSPFVRKESSVKRVHPAEMSPPLDFNNVCNFITEKGDIVEVALLSSIYAIGNFPRINEASFDLSDRHSGFDFPAGIDIHSLESVMDPGTGDIPLSSLPNVTGSNPWPKYLDCDWEYKNAYSAGVFVGYSSDAFKQEKTSIDADGHIIAPALRNEARSDYSVYMDMADGKNIYDEDNTLESLLVNSIYDALTAAGYDKYHPICDIRMEVNLYDREVYDDTGEVVQ